MRFKIRGGKTRRIKLQEGVFVENPNRRQVQDLLDERVVSSKAEVVHILDTLYLLYLHTHRLYTHGAHPRLQRTSALKFIRSKRDESLRLWVEAVRSRDGKPPRTHQKRRYLKAYDERVGEAQMADAELRGPEVLVIELRFQVPRMQENGQVLHLDVSQEVIELVSIEALDTARTHLWKYITDTSEILSKQMEADIALQKALTRRPPTLTLIRGGKV